MQRTVVGDFTSRCRRAARFGERTRLFVVFFSVLFGLALRPHGQREFNASDGQKNVADKRSERQVTLNFPPKEAKWRSLQRLRDSLRMTARLILPVRFSLRVIDDRSGDFLLHYDGRMHVPVCDSAGN